MLEDLTRRIRDWRLKHEDLRDPIPVLLEAEQNLDRMDAPGRRAIHEHVVASAESYYVGRHGMDRVPEDVGARLKNMGRRIERLDRLDHAHETLAKYGGPPTKETIRALVERGKDTREKRMEAYAKAPAQMEEKTHAKAKREHSMVE